MTQAYGSEQYLECRKGRAAPKVVWQKIMDVVPMLGILGLDLVLTRDHRRDNFWDFHRLVLGAGLGSKRSREVAASWS